MEVNINHIHFLSFNNKASMDDASITANELINNAADSAPVCDTNF